MENDNKIQIKIKSLSENEPLIRSIISCYVLSLNPSVSELSDIKTAVSEAITNCIVHAYPDSVGEITVEAVKTDSEVHINVFDNGVGIENVNEALVPFYTTKESEERSGMGFTIMQSFMDEIEVKSAPREGTKVYMLKKIKSGAV